METPHIDHLTAQDYEHVYEPAEDSFLLLDALESDLDFIEHKLNPTVCLEIGPGSGVIITALSKRLTCNTLCLACDINPYACQVTKRTALRNATRVDCIRGNLVDALNTQKIDLLIFNPPYVVTSDEELKQMDKFGDCTEDNLVYSWAGGQHGRRIIDVLIEKLPNILSAQGVFYLLLLRENKPKEIMEKLMNMGFNSETLMERRIPGEYLYVLKIKH
ncbi:methyltransferase N6AMT1 [Lucilia sericata]|uniref:methyltransferase N6AMT1 n=1 Tax=Lucilia sericata TaxID=13632 RepID=UPI0018A87B7B|nr:methyltransferase N6AMT1 [Lucilia sericata]